MVPISPAAPVLVVSGLLSLGQLKAVRTVAANSELVTDTGNPELAIGKEVLNWLYNGCLIDVGQNIERPDRTPARRRRR